MPSIRVLLCLIFIFLVHGSFAWLNNQPQDAGTDVPSGKLMSLSFAPFREGFSPLEEKFPLPEHIDEDLRLLADKTECIRTYSSLGGQQPTPALARKHGLKMIQGAWLGYGYKDNSNEVNALIKSANENPDVVKRVIVGNEVLLRGDMDVDRLIGYIREVKKAVKQPVSYADVWSMYMKYPKLINEVDFITIHILPYWEDEPISVENASQHLEKIVKQVEDEARGIAPGKPILIGESGWPSAGRQRGMAIPGVVNEAKFIRGMIQVANRHGFDYNIVEAFNQPWKSELEGVVGANWGLFSADREPVFPLTGPVNEAPNWPIRFAVATLIWLLAIARYSKKLEQASLIRMLAFFTLAQVFSVCLVTLADFLWYTSYSTWQRLYTVALVIANTILGALLLERGSDILIDKPGSIKLANSLRAGYLIFILLALYKTYGLAMNGRYLSFPIEQFAIPAFGVFGLIACLWLKERKFNGRVLAFDSLIGGNLQSRRDRFLAYLLSFGAIALIFGEAKAFMDGRDFIQAHPGFSEGLPFALSYTLYNQQLLGWLACLLMLSLPFWTKHRSKQDA
ncbi:exo-beta-1,3-glucanase [Methylomonas sp. EFPC1]|uniref:glycoside hydrolase family 17 protein n=1 Tax=unclassified Methylomonas TaxID=2608980 RepID=UPI00051C9970|nr:MULTISPECIES: exo-beta-1,3-glucanase [unclassified Methylomonas]PKD42242.1 exo-beta-1,3-glucanase [Methylomonas sp. Kb3]QBC25745.1 exo-beta-1,3-glucanase [Methylomonas sp. LW13]QSB01665.1 exo-beta-1,3-glucanase [Methylomonas sp. EFPC1]